MKSVIENRKYRFFSGNMRGWWLNQYQQKGARWVTRPSATEIPTILQLQLPAVLLYFSIQTPQNVGLNSFFDHNFLRLRPQNQPLVSCWLRLLSRQKENIFDGSYELITLTYPSRQPQQREPIHHLMANIISGNHIPGKLVL